MSFLKVDNKEQLEALKSAVGTHIDFLTDMAVPEEFTTGGQFNRDEFYAHLNQLLEMKLLEERLRHIKV